MPSAEEVTRRGLDMFLSMQGAKSPQEAQAIAAMHQKLDTHELIECVDKLDKTVKMLAKSSSKLNWATWVLVGLTIMLALTSIVPIVKGG